MSEGRIICAVLFVAMVRGEGGTRIADSEQPTGITKTRSRKTALNKPGIIIVNVIIPV